MKTVEVSFTLDAKKDSAGTPANADGMGDAALGRIPRITKLMALAIRFQGLVERGEVQDYADLARLGYVTRARITQIMNLLNLAPDIQEALLFLPRTTSGRDSISERDIRPIAAIPTWSGQRTQWDKLPHQS